jgi:hypothetical protein
MNRGNLEGTILVPVKNLEQELFRLFSIPYVWIVRTLVPYLLLSFEAPTTAK